MEAINIIDKTEVFSLPEHETDEIVQQIMKIGQFSKLEDNWDSYGGKAIAFEVCEKAAKYLYRAFIELSNGAGSIALPFVAPANDGSIVLEWVSEKLELIVVFRPTEKIEVEYLTVEKTNGKETGNEGKFDSVAAFVETIKRFSVSKT